MAIPPIDINSLPCYNPPWEDIISKIYTEITKISALKYTPYKFYNTSSPLSYTRTINHSKRSIEIFDIILWSHSLIEFFVHFHIYTREGLGIIEQLLSLLFKTFLKRYWKRYSFRSSTLSVSIETENWTRAVICVRVFSLGMSELFVTLGSWRSETERTEEQRRNQSCLFSPILHPYIPLLCSFYFAMQIQPERSNCEPDDLIHISSFQRRFDYAVFQRCVSLRFSYE